MAYFATPTAQSRLRQAQLDRLKAQTDGWDIIVIGGGITGAGIFSEAAAAGLKVLLIEQQDFAWGTSSRSSKMVHGGLRYLGSGQLALARDSVQQRQQLLQALPGLVEPLPFMLPHYRGKFPGPGLFKLLLTVYDYLAGQRYRQFIKRGIQDFWLPGLQQAGLIGVSKFADAVTDDARLVMRVLQAGQASGGMAVNYLQATGVLQQQQHVCGIRVQDALTTDSFSLEAKVVINASGVWTDELRAQLGAESCIRPLRGSHLVLPFWRLPIAFALSFFHPEDQRPVFVFPWEGVTVIGTTDLDHQPIAGAEASISAAEVAYLLQAANQQFPQAKLALNDIQATWSGVRPVVSEQPRGKSTATAKPSAEKREHAIWDDNGMISVAGGKLTTFRLIAAEVLAKAASTCPALRYIAKTEQTATAFFTEQSSVDQSSGAPGAALSQQAQKRLFGRYGADAVELLALLRAQPDLARRIATTDSLWVELVWACQREQVVHLDDLLLRRTRIGLLLKNGAQQLMAELKLRCQAILGWDDAHWQAEWARYNTIIATHYALPATMQTSGANR